MLKKTIKYTDYNGEEREEDFYFNLNKAELVEIQTGTKGGFAGMIQKAQKEQDVPKIMEIFKYIILKTIGKKSDDGKRFIKSKEISDEFEQSPAYEVLFMELLKDSDCAKKFIESVVPELTAEQKAAYEKEIAKLENK